MLLELVFTQFFGISKNFKIKTQIIWKGRTINFFFFLNYYHVPGTELGNLHKWKLAGCSNLHAKDNNPSLVSRNLLWFSKQWSHGSSLFKVWRLVNCHLK